MVTNSFCLRNKKISNNLFSLYFLFWLVLWSISEEGKLKMCGLEFQTFFSSIKVSRVPDDQDLLFHGALIYKSVGLLVSNFAWGLIGNFCVLGMKLSVFTVISTFSSHPSATTWTAKLKWACHEELSCSYQKKVTKYYVFEFVPSNVGYPLKKGPEGESNYSNKLLFIIPFIMEVFIKNIKQEITHPRLHVKNVFGIFVINSLFISLVSNLAAYTVLFLRIQQPQTQHSARHKLGSKMSWCFIWNVSCRFAASRLAWNSTRGNRGILLPCIKRYVNYWNAWDLITDNILTSEFSCGDLEAFFGSRFPIQCDCMGLSRQMIFF